MSRSSNQKRKRKARVATGVPCEKPLQMYFGASVDLPFGGIQPTTYGHWATAEVVFHPPDYHPTPDDFDGCLVCGPTYLLTGVN